MLVARQSPLPLPPVAATLLAALALQCWLAATVASLVGTVVLALAAWHLLVRARAPQPERAAAVLLLLPSVVLTRDALWAAASVMALTAALDRKHREMLLWTGIAIGLNVLAAAILPLMLALAIQRRVPFKLWPIAPLALGTTLLLVTLLTPAPIASARELSLSYVAPNLWMIVQDMPGLAGLPLIGLAICAATGASAAFTAWFSARPLHARAVLDAALLCLLAIDGLLPRIDAHAFLPVTVLAVVLALTTGARRHWHVALLVQTGSLLALGGMGMAGAVPMLIATFLQARAVLAPAANDNPLMARTV